MCCVHFTLCCWETMLYWMLGTDLTSEPSHFGNVQFSSQITSHSPSLARPTSNNTTDWVMRCWGCTLPGSLLSWFIYVKGNTRGEYILTESQSEGFIFSLFLVIISRTCTKVKFDIETSKYEDQGQWLGMQWIGLIYYSFSFMWSMKELSSIAFP